MKSTRSGRLYHTEDSFPLTKNCFFGTYLGEGNHHNSRKVIPPFFFFRVFKFFGLTIIIFVLISLITMYLDMFFFKLNLFWVKLTSWICKCSDSSPNLGNTKPLFLYVYLSPLSFSPLLLRLKWHDRW